MALRKMHFLPIAISCMTFVIFPIIYAASVLAGHVPAFLPYVSDTGTYPPESCLFSTSLNLLSLMLAILQWIFYKQAKQTIESQDKNGFLLFLLKAIVWLGCGNCVGLFIVANYQITNQIFIHYMGACLFFSCATFNTAVTSFISYRTHISPLILSKFRLLIVIIQSLVLITEAIATPASLFLFDGSDMTNWKPEDGGYIFHVISAFGEWIFLLLIVVFILTCVSEMKKVHVEFIKVQLICPGTADYKLGQQAIYQPKYQDIDLEKKTDIQSSAVNGLQTSDKSNSPS